MALPAPLRSTVAPSTKTMRAEEAFHAAVAEAKQLGIEAAKDEVYERAMDRMDRASSTLLMFIIKQADPSYREGYRTPEDDEAKVSLRDVMNAIRPEPDAAASTDSANATDSV